MTGAPPRLYTLGYQRHRTAEELAELSATYGFRTIVDVRFRPWPARRSTVESVGLGYLWERRLGNSAGRRGGIRIVDLDAVEMILSRLRAGESVAIMCTCAEPEFCHRRVIADECRRRLPGLVTVDL